jgi:hypothetical protein
MFRNNKMAVPPTLLAEDQQFIRNRPTWSQGLYGVPVINRAGMFVSLRHGGTSAPYNPEATCPMSERARQAVYTCAAMTRDPAKCLTNAQNMCGK